MSELKSALVLGVHSFATPHQKTGIQFIAEGLARRGVAVDYVSVPSSPLDVLGAARRKRLVRVWPRLGRSACLSPESGLREFAFVSPVPVHGALVRGEAMLGAVRALAPGWLRRTRYDLCIHDVGPCMAYLPLVRARWLVLRLNDFPHGFGEMPAPLVAALERRLGNGGYDQVWAVSQPLVSYACSLAPADSVRLVPNGFDATRFDTRGLTGGDGGNKAVYLGNNAPWLDVALVKAAARLVLEWEFHFVGQGHGGPRAEGNVRFLPAVPHREVARCLRGYSVGLLPYRNLNGRMDYVHRPLKFYEYFAAGLGVAVSDVGGLRDGIGPFACYGNTPESFARAVVESLGAAEAVGAAQRRAFLGENDWSSRMDQCMGLLRTLSSGG